MLKHLNVVNYALIKELDISFNPGFSTLTGETGAGKSIMLGALGMVLGNRADTRVLHDVKRKCTAEATFIINDYGLEELFAQYDLDYDHECIFRREINQNGKSRAFINDTPVSLQVLKEIASRLINIHSQHEILVLNNRDFQLAMLDSFTGHEDKVMLYQKRFAEYRALAGELEELKKLYSEQLAQYDYDLFLFEELTAAKLDEIDLHSLEQELKLLENSEEIRTTLHQLSQLFNGEPLNFLSSLRTGQATLARIASGSNMDELIERLNSLYLEGEDLEREVVAKMDSVVDDPAQMELLREKTGQINHLLQKHRVSEIADLIRIRDEIDTRLKQMSFTDEAISKTEKKLAGLKEVVYSLAGELSEARQSAVESLMKHLAGILSQLGMTDSVVEMKMEPLPEPSADGIDRVSLLFSANKGSKPDLISIIASGGELSRLMLSVKSVLSAKKLIPTIIFDEIDSGVSGDIAGKTGLIMQKMAEKMQVIAITHLPQIAARGDYQYLAYKKSDNRRTVSNVRLLSSDEREYEIARMLSDDEPSPESLANARVLLLNNKP